MLLLRDLRAPLDVDEAALAQLAAQALHVPAREVRSVRLVRRALDARKKQDIHLRLHLLAALDPALEASLLKRGLPHVAPCPTQEAVEPIAGSETPRGRIAVAGLGPAGLFAAWLLARQGYRPLVIERGRPVEERAADVERFWAGGALLAESNAMFGEGGAGTFSDGKLTSRSKDPRADTVLRVLAEHGAPEEIRYLAKPHIGTDRLRTVVRSLRRQIESLGGEVRFSARLDGLAVDGAGALSSILVHGGAAGERIPCAALVLAIGQGARDTYRMLHSLGVAMEPKPFAVGVRVEHPQPLIDRAQFGALAGDPRLGAAEYRLTARAQDRGVGVFPVARIAAHAVDGGLLRRAGRLHHHAARAHAERVHAAAVFKVNVEFVVRRAECGVACKIAVLCAIYRLCAVLDARADGKRLRLHRYTAFFKQHFKCIARTMADSENDVCGLDRLIHTVCLGNNPANSIVFDEQVGHLRVEAHFAAERFNLFANGADGLRQLVRADVRLCVK